MPGLSIVGATLDAREDLVAAAVCRVLREGGSEASEFVPYRLEPPASPLVSARHSGSEIDPAAIMAGARRVASDGGVLVSALGGGVLAPLTPRYSVRDLARDVGAPVVVAVRARPGAAAQGRLAAEAARGAGLHVAGAVLTDWPESPPRVLLDERTLLGELPGQPVEVLPEGGAAEAASRWPIERWLEPPAAAETPPADEGGEVVLEPYAEWEPHEVGDPRATPRPQI